jgi:hypothetical protein
VPDETVQQDCRELSDSIEQKKRFRKRKSKDRKSQRRRAGKDKDAKNMRIALQFLPSNLIEVEE